MKHASMPLTSSSGAGEEMVRRTARRRLRLRPAEVDECLTSREHEILGCFARGLNTAAVAQLLSVSPTTVRNHAQRILSKLRVHSRLEAVAHGYARGLLSMSEASDPKPRKGARP